MYHDSDCHPWKLDKKWEDLTPEEWIVVCFSTVKSSLLLDNCVHLPMKNMTLMGSYIFNGLFDLNGFCRFLKMALVSQQVIINWCLQGLKTVTI